MIQQTLRLEFAALTMLGVAAFGSLGLSWWWFVGLLLAPDISMLGYLLGTRVGAHAYNLFHNIAVAVLVIGIGWWTGVAALQLAGIILFTHANMDRMLGYGLKYPDDFRHTHLGWIGEPEERRSRVEHS